VKRIAAWILAATFALGLLAGCGGASSNNDPNSNPGNTPGTSQNEPKKDEPQELTLNIGTEPPQLDSALTTDTVSFVVLNQVMEGLVRPGEGGAVVKGSGMAADWTVSDDGLVWTFKIKDAKWSDGQPVTSKDFAYAWMRALDPNTGSQYNYQLFYIKGAQAFSTLSLEDDDFAAKYEALKKEVAIETPDDKTLKVTLERPVSYFESLLSFPTYLPQRQDVVEKHGDKYAAEADTMVYNGPFVLKSWQHESEIVLEKNPNYWDAGTVKLTKVTFKMINDSNTAINMFEANQLDSTGLPGQYIAQYKDKPGFFSRAEPTTFYLVFNLGDANPEKAYLKNVHIRRAISLAIDRQTYADAVLADGSQPATSYTPPTININGQSFQKLTGDLLSTKADPAKAQEELKLGLQELGLDKLPPMEMLSGTGDQAKKLAQGVQGMVQQNLPGVILNIVPLDFKVRLERQRLGQFDIVFGGWGADYDDPNTFLDMWVTGGGHNDARWSNPEYDALIKQAAETNDPAARAEAFKRAEQLLMSELPIVPLFFDATNGIRKPWVKGVRDFAVGASTDLKYAYIEGRSK
jgi:oligopeptide transport system substrate-binding protein